MTGGGSNGKSLTNELMSLALGDYYMSCDISLITRKRGQSNQASPEKLRMKARRMGVFQESDEGEKMNVGIVKEITGGDKMLMRDLYKGTDDMVEFKPQMKYFLTANIEPEITSFDDGTWRRIRRIEFGSKFVSNPNPMKPNEFLIDLSLKLKISQWAPAFMSYLIHIYMSELKNNEEIIEPPEVMASTIQYKMENDFFTEYFMDRLTITSNPNDIMSYMTVWEDFKIWYRAAYDNKSLPKRPEFLKFMTKQIGIESKIKTQFTNITFNSLTNEGTNSANSTNEETNSANALDHNVEFVN
jgi:phage/plasmid-associated DNA primase